MASRMVYRAVWVPSFLAFSGMVAVFASQPYKTPEAGAMKTYSTADGFISLKRPGNWRPRQFSANEMKTHVGFEPSADVKFEVLGDFAGSLMADLDRSGNAQMQSLAGMAGSDGTPNLGGLGGVSAPAAPQKSPTEKAHDRLGAAMEKDKEAYPDFIDGKPVKGSVGGQEALLSEFTFTKSGLFRAREMTGKRATLLTTDKQVSVVYYCPKDAAAKLMPVMDTMLQSLRVGQTTGN